MSGTEKKIPSWKNKQVPWLMTKWGRRMRYSILGGTVLLFPVGSLVLNGPLLKKAFPYLHNVDYDLPDHLQKLMKEEYDKWLVHEGRSASDSVVKFSVQREPESLDTIPLGSLGVRFGAQFALPFYARFRDEEDASQFCKKHLEPFEYKGKQACILWDTPVGRQLISTFVLSPAALRFLINRDLYTRRDYWTYAMPALSWVAYFFVATFITVGMQQTRIVRGRVAAYLAIYAITVCLACYFWWESSKLQTHLCSVNSDSLAAEMSMEHSNGAREFYVKFLRRNRILRELLPDGDKYFSLVGDLKQSATPYMNRLENVVHIRKEEEEYAQGDDF